MAEAGGRKLTSCANVSVTRPTSKTEIPAPHCIGLRSLQSILIDHDMKVLDLSCHRLGNLKRKCLRRLRQQRFLNISVRDPNDLAVVVIETCNHMRNVDRFSALIEEFAMQRGMALCICVNLLVHDSDHRVRRSRHQRGFDIHAYVLDLTKADAREIDAIGRYLLGKKDVQNLVKAALFIDG